MTSHSQSTTQMMRPSFFEAGSLVLLLQPFYQCTALSFSHGHCKRRHILSRSAAVAAAALLPFGNDGCDFSLSSSSASAALLLPDKDEIQTTITGVQFRDDRIGQGDLVQAKDVVVLHLQGMRRDGTIIVDTRKQRDGTPILHKMGGVVDFDMFGGDSGARPIITLGIEDGIRGMRYGGIRRMVIPSPLGYGHAGVSRFDAMRMGLLQSVPRDDLLRFQVEILRCLDVPLTNAEGNPTDETARACCTESTYPCQPSGTSKQTTTTVDTDQ